MSCNPCDPFCPTVRVYDPPVTVVNDVFHTQIVEVVHRVNVVTRHHCVPCEKHLYEYSYQDEDARNQSPSNNRGSNNRSRSNRNNRSNRSCINSSNRNRSRNGRSQISKVKAKQLAKKAK